MAIKRPVKTSAAAAKPDNLLAALPATHPWRTHVLASAKNPSDYGDQGQGAFLTWQATGDTVYRDQAAREYTLAAAALVKDTVSANNVRQWGAEFAYAYGVLKDGGADATALRASVERLGKWIVRDPADMVTAVPYSGGWPAGWYDGDAVVGQYVALMHVDRALGTDHLNRPAWDSSGKPMGQIGGLTATGLDHATARNAVRVMAESFSAGGEWDESTQYNANTVSILLTWAMLADGKDLPHFPDLKAFAAQAAGWLGTSHLPDLSDAVVWGDSPDDRLPPYYEIRFLVAVHVASGDPRPLALAAELIRRGKWTAANYWGSGGHWMGFMAAAGLFDPAVLLTTPPAYSPLPDGLYQSVGGGHVRYLKGGALFHAHVPGTPREQHWPRYGLDFGWCDGTGEYHSNIVNNGLSHADPLAARDATAYGLAARSTVCGLKEAVETPTGVIIRSETSGPYYTPGYRRPPEFYRREMETEFTAPSTVRVKNTFHAVGADPDPVAYAFDAADRPRIVNRSARWEVAAHARTVTAPVESSPGVFTYTTPTGQNRRITAAGHDRAVVQQMTSAGTGGKLTPARAKDRWRVVLRADAKEAVVQYTDEPAAAVPPPANTPPTLGVPGDQSTRADAPLSVTLTVGDAETPAAALAVTVASSNPAVLPPAGIVVGGAGASRVLTMTPAAGPGGTTTVTVTVTDAGGLTAAKAFGLTVTPVPNAGPAVSAVADQTATAGVAVGPLAFSVDDAETPADELVVTVASSDTTLLPLSGIVLGGAGANRTVTLTPAAGRTGTARVTLTVEDGKGLTASAAFALTVTEPPPPAPVAVRLTVTATVEMSDGTRKPVKVEFDV